MYPLFESIRCENGRIRHLRYHEARMQRSREQLFGLSTPVSIRNHIHKPPEAQSGNKKVRVNYGENIGSVSILPYQNRRLESIRVIPIAFDYEHKWEDRNNILEACKELTPVEEALFIKDNIIYDTSYSNIALYDGVHWYTPEKYLLRGTMRDYLLAKGKILSKQITREDLPSYSHIALINAMNPLGRLVYPIDIIKREG